MNTDAEQKFRLLIKDMVENTDFEDDLNLMIKEDGQDQMPNLSFFNMKRGFRHECIRKIKNSRQAAAGIK